MQTEEPVALQTTANIYDRLKSCKHMLNSSANAYTAFKALGELETKKIEQLSVISSFFDTFYNNTCAQKHFVDDLKFCLQIEIHRLQQQVN